MQSAEASGVRAQGVDSRSSSDLRSRLVTFLGSISILTYAIAVVALVSAGLYVVSDATRTLEDVQATGVIVKDLDSGLVDFPSVREGENVLLCWQLGEDEVAFWHGYDDGFAGRRPI